MPYANKEKQLAYWKLYNEKRKETKAQYNNNYWEKNKEKLIIDRSVWAKNNPDKIRNYVLKRRYGTTIEEYKKLLENQNHSCAICGMHEGEFKKSLHLDHCHKINKIRGLLCANCNTALGHFKEDVDLIYAILNGGNVSLNKDSKKGLSKFCDNPELLKRSIEYLNKLTTQS